MHIGIDTRLTAYRTGGISTYMRRVVEALESLDQHNQYTVFQSRKAKTHIANRFREARLWTPCHHRWERLALSVELTRFRLDLLHTPDFIPPYRGGRHHIITVHDLTFLHYPQYLTADSRRYYNDQIESAVMRADHILVDSDATRRDLMTMLQVPDDKITIHSLGVEERFRPFSTAEMALAKEALQLPADYLLFVGTFEPRKNITGLLNAYHLLRERMPTAPPLVLVGRRGWLFDETMQQIKSLKLGEQVIWREDIHDEMLPAVYNLGIALVTPSFYEGFGLPALEAMACGTIPIVSNRSSLPEVVGDVGLQVNPDDVDSIARAMEFALNDPGWREHMRQMGLERARQFTWSETARIVLSTYQRFA
jgi:glycosyltransferase involved in cell wall biosynthesis